MPFLLLNSDKEYSDQQSFNSHVQALLNPPVPADQADRGAPSAAQPPEPGVGTGAATPVLPPAVATDLPSTVAPTPAPVPDATPGPTSTPGPAPVSLPTATPTPRTSQFGLGLSSGDAYAACGPAAAIAFANSYGRNPTAQEAMQLAREVGWTPDQGMAGVQSEQALLARMGVSTKLEQQIDWQHVAADAGSGNPVIIDTPGHYYYISGSRQGANGQTEFNVGTSGTDLKGGSAWMTAAQINSQAQSGGAARAALYADNPTSPAPSVAASGSPLEQFGNHVSALTSGAVDLAQKAASPLEDFAGHVKQLTNGAVDLTGGSVAGAGQASSPPSAPTATPTPDAQNVPSGAMSGLSQAGVASAGSVPPAGLLPPPTPAATEPPSMWDRLGTGISEVFKNVFGGIPGAGSGSGGTDFSQSPSPQDASQAGNVGQALQDVGRVGATAWPTVPHGAMSYGPADQRTTPPELSTYGQLQKVAPPVLDSAKTATDIEAKYGGGIRDGKWHAPDYSNITPEDQQALSNATVAVAGVSGPVGSRPTASPELQKIRGMYDTPSPVPTTSLVDRIEQARTALVRGFTDRQVDINKMQQAYSKALGRPLNADEMAAELQRLSPDPAAAVKIDEGLKPAIQSVGPELYADLRDYVTARSNVQVADALGNDLRNFSGGVTKADSQKAMTDMEAELGPARFQAVKDAADQVTAFSRSLRQRLVDSGVFSAQQAADMEAKYPDWAKTRILDYLNDPARPGYAGSGKKIGLASRDLHLYTQEGTTRAREDPIASTVAYAHQVEQMANKNEAFQAMLNMDQASPTPMLRKVAQDFSPTNRQVTMNGFVNGQKVKYVTDNKALGQAINGTGVSAVPNWVSAWQSVFRSLATSRNPVFLAGNAALDIPTYTFRTAIRDGGPQHLPGIMADLAKGYVDAFQGLLQNEYRGAGTSAFLKGGGGQSGYFTGGEGQARQTIADLQRSNVFQINGVDDLKRLVRDLVTLKPVEALGERIELGPRVAAYNRALQRGANQTQAVIDGRTVTVDFSQGGTVTKFINQAVPFFNVGFQGPVQIARAFKDNPLAFAATTGTLIGLPTVAAEAWNHADPQRVQDYKDVPDYVKNQGIVVMLPGEAPMDASGNRKPLYAVLKLREWSPFASIARDATARALGDDSKSWQDMALSAGAGLSPTNSTSIGQAGSEAMSGIPVLPAALQISQNRDFFRNRDIVTQRADENASAVSKTLTPIIQAAVDKLGLNMEIRPSAVDFFIRNQGAGVGGAVLGASDLGQARQDTSPTSLPGVGGLVGRFAGAQTGQGLQSARDDMLSPEARTILRQNGITVTPGAVGGSFNQIPLRLDEETRFQQLFNQYLDAAIKRTAASADFQRMTQVGKDSLMQGAITAARGRAGLEVLNSIPAAEKQRRLAQKSTAPALPGFSAPVRAP